MSKNRYLVDFDTEFSEDKQTLRLIRNNEVFEVLECKEANDFYKLLVKIDDLKLIGFTYCFLNFDDKLDEWYEKVITPHTDEIEGETLMYFPELDLFEIPEKQIIFTEMSRAEKMIKDLRK